MQDNDQNLRRSLSLTLVTFYGLGNILGAGIYVLIGKVVGNAGYFAPVSFLMASIIAGITAFTYAELSSRFPVSAGEAVYVQYGFGVKQLSLVIGLLIVMTGVVSAATIARGFVGYLNVFIDLPGWLAIISLVSCLGLLAVWGILESVSVAALFTLLEVFGLLLVLYVAAPSFVNLPGRLSEFTPSFNPDIWPGIFIGAFLAFYAYVGFEDMVNVAEEVKRPERNLPIAILVALTLSTLLYIAIVFAALLIMSPEELAQSHAPLANVYEKITGNKPLLISAVSIFAVVNGALIQIIMASRVCYGLAKQNWLPKLFGKISTKTHTPINATIVITATIIVMALWLPIETLARATSYFLLVVFSFVNLALWRIKLKKENVEDVFIVPLAIPISGFFVCLTFLIVQLIVSWL